MSEVTPRFKEPKVPRRRSWWSSVAPVSEKRAERREERARVVRATHVRAGWRCEARGMFGLDCSPHGEWGGLECHEIQRRSADREAAYDLARTASLCSAHHRYVTEYRPGVKESWLWVSRYEQEVGRQ